VPRLLLVPWLPLLPVRCDCADARARPAGLMLRLSRVSRLPLLLPRVRELLLLLLLLLLPDRPVRLPARPTPPMASTSRAARSPSLRKSLNTFDGSFACSWLSEMMPALSSRHDAARQYLIDRSIDRSINCVKRDGSVGQTCEYDE
jgi:hypothetical protein